MRISTVAAVLATFTVLASGATAQARELVVYSANYRVSDALTAAYEQKYPGVKISSVSGSTGPTAERAIAEMANPQADVVYLLNGPTLERLRDAGLFEPYRPENTSIDDRHMDPDHFFTYFMFNSMVMLVNTERLAQRGLPRPQSWGHLLNPAYRGEITVASPLKSGTGVTIYTTLLDVFGWHYMEYLDANVFAYNDGGGAAGQQAGAGEIAIGLTHDAAAFEQVAAGRPVEIVFPDILPANYQGGGIVRGGPNPEEARRFMDFVASAEGAAVMTPFVTATTAPGASQLPEGSHVIWDALKRPIERKDFLEEWRTRFGR